MDIGRITEIDQSKVNYNIKTEKVQASEESNIINPDDEYKDLKKDLNDYNEVVLDNRKFGYDEEAETLYVKIQKGNDEISYPSEEMLKLKAYMLNKAEEKYLNNLEN